MSDPTDIEDIAQALFGAWRLANLRPIGAHWLVLTEPEKDRWRFAASEAVRLHEQTVRALEAQLAAVQAEAARVKREWDDHLLWNSARSDLMESLADLAAVQAERDALLGLDSQWPLPELLLRLADGASHLLDHHDCDALGHEGLRYAERRAREILDMLGRWPGSAGREPAWSHDLTGYVPAEGDWVLHRSMPTVRILVYQTGGERVYINGGYLLASGIIAYWRPPGPPPVPEDGSHSK